MGVALLFIVFLINLFKHLNKLNHEQTIIRSSFFIDRLQSGN